MRTVPTYTVLVGGGLWLGTVIGCLAGVSAGARFLDRRGDPELKRWASHEFDQLLAWLEAHAARQKLENAEAIKDVNIDVLG
jgi:hypothetical protein